MGIGGDGERFGGGLLAGVVVSWPDLDQGDRPPEAGIRPIEIGNGRQIDGQAVGIGVELVDAPLFVVGDGAVNTGWGFAVGPDADLKALVLG
jgi:hypothetical protein